MRTVVPRKKKGTAPKRAEPNSCSCRCNVSESPPSREPRRIIAQRLGVKSFHGLPPPCALPTEDDACSLRVAKGNMTVRRGAPPDHTPLPQALRHAWRSARSPKVTCLRRFYSATVQRACSDRLMEAMRSTGERPSVG